MASALAPENDNGEVVSTSDPPCRLLVRSKEGLEVYTIPERVQSAKVAASSPSILLKGALTMMHPSPDGSAVYVHLSGHGIVKVNLDAQSLVASTSATPPPCFLAFTAGVQMMHISPLGNFLLTWERWHEERCPLNLRVWQASTGRLLAAFSQKALRREAWPYLQWTVDEQFALLMVTNEVRVYPVDSMLQSVETTADAPLSNGDNIPVPRFTDKMRISGVTSISLPQTPPTASSPASVGYFFTSFCPATKEKPAKAALHEYRPNMSNSDNTSGEFPARLSKSLFQAEEMKVHWNPTGDTALITLQTSVDATGQSYYGSSHLFMLSSSNQDVIAVPLSQEGPVLDVQWMPHPDKPPCFVVVAGRMPSMTSLHHGKTAQVTFLFGHAHRNTVSWAPHGRFLCLAGYGNLSGSMSFWDRNKLKLCSGNAVNMAGQLRSDAVVGHDWSPDSRLFMVCTTSPRMNVDNGIRIYRYSGQEIPEACLPWKNTQYRPDKLLEVRFVPAILSAYPDRPQSPSPEGLTEPLATLTPAAVAAPAAAPPSVARYVPPSARNRAGGGGTSLAERLRREKEGQLQAPTKVQSNQPVAVAGVRNVMTGKVIPGLAPTDSGKSKSAQKREKLKKKKEEEERRQEQGLPEPSPAPSAVTDSKTSSSQLESAADAEKKARKLKKTLKQIEELKEKDLASLNEDQKAKLASEAEVRAELLQLGF